MAGGPNWAPKNLGPAGLDLSASSNLFNAQKRSFGIDLKSPDGRRVMRELIAKTDLFISNMSFPAIEGLGLGYESLRPLNPRLLHLVMPGFGTTGPYQDYKSWGPNLSSLTGFDNLTGGFIVEKCCHDLDYLTHFERKFRKEGRPIHRMRFVKPPGGNGAESVS